MSDEVKMVLKGNSHHFGETLRHSENCRSERSWGQIRHLKWIGLNPTILTQLQGVLHEGHPYVTLYKHAFQIINEKPPEEQKDVEVSIHLDEGTDGRRYNLPTADELAAVVPGTGDEECNSDRDIVLRLQDNTLKRISQMHPHYASLHYVLLFARGEKGWHKHLKLHPGVDGAIRTKNGTVSQTLYHAYHLHIRPPEWNSPVLFWGGRLLLMHGQPLSRAS